MQYKDINKIFSEAVAKTLAEGYIICTNTMGGTQGEIVFVNFIDKDGNHYALTLDKRIGYRREDGVGLDYYEICWMESKELKGELKQRDVTFWRGDKYVEVIGRRRFYIVGENYFIEDTNEAKRIYEVRWKHYRSGSEDDNYRAEVEIPMNASTRKLVARLWKAHRASWHKAFKAIDINSAKMVRYGTERRIYINGEREGVLVNG